MGLAPPPSHRRLTDPLDRSLLTAKQSAAVELARSLPLSYGIRLLAAPDGRPLVIVGEAHVKLKKAQAVGQQLIAAFELRGVETFPRKRVLAGGVLGVLVEGPRRLLRALSVGAIKDSTIRDALAAKHGKTFRLESVSRIPLSLHLASLHLALIFGTMLSVLLLTAIAPHLRWSGFDAISSVLDVFNRHFLALLPALLLRRYQWSWVLFPAVGILTVRDATMAEGTAEMLRENPTPPSAMVLMGRAHLPGYEKELIDRYGFTRLEDEPQQQIATGS